MMEITFGEGKVIKAETNGHTIITDQPCDNGGENSAPSPVDLYLAAIGTCSGAYVKSFCDKRGIPTDRIKLVQKTEFDEDTDLPVSVIIDIRLPEDFPDKYRDSIISAADLCKVKKSVISPPVFSITSTKSEL